jgi:hypothetical protein
MLLDNRFRDGRCGQIEALAQLLLQETEQRGKEVIGFILGCVLPQLAQALANDMCNLPATAQAGIVGKLVSAPTPNECRKPGKHGHSL